MNRIQFSNILSAIVVLAAGSASSYAAAIDLSGASTGTSITVPGASFAQGFAGQTVAGQGLTGSPTDPLTLAPSGTLEVTFFNGANTILPQPGNQAPLAVLLDNLASSISWTMGFGNPPSSVTVDFYGPNGSLVQSVNQSILDGYNTYAFSGFGDFQGVAIYNNNDPSGLRFYNFEVTAAITTPDTGATVMLLGIATLGCAAIRRRH